MVGWLGPRAFRVSPVFEGEQRPGAGLQRCARHKGKPMPPHDTYQCGVPVHLTQVSRGIPPPPSPLGEGRTPGGTNRHSAPDERRWSLSLCRC